MCGLEIPTDDKVIIGLKTADDAGVYKISEDLALIQTVDFFTPIVDDPFEFGQIAAANALSDVYAMGGVPKTAMNLVAYPLKKMGGKVLRDILSGGIEKLKEAQTVLLGGHSIEDDELKYGLSVTGFVHPKKILANQGLRPGDRLILTKPLGTGILNTAIKGGLASEKAARTAVALMAMLNKGAAEVIRDFPVSACTDVTGFGLLGHLAEMIDGTGLEAVVDSRLVPVLEDVVGFASMGLVPAGAHNNRLFREYMVALDPVVSPVTRDILFDPQTSGGLLIGCPEDQAEALKTRLVDKGIEYASVIGRIEKADISRIRVV